ncbi:hypothetical protein [Flavobacterium gawalongense]|uniref:hypothetical protein n=1 Tax=Flavobacterium gawalongense TaxID=2594432 RepID=UPI001C3F96A1|nr:hypothetical protein [Flavobacterium gawalongense]
MKANIIDCNNVFSIQQKNEFVSESINNDYSRNSIITYKIKGGIYTVALIKQQVYDLV